MAEKTGTLGRRGVAGADGDLRFVKFNAKAASGAGDAYQRGAKISFYVNGESLDGRNVKHTAALIFVYRRSIRWRKHEAIDTPQKGCESFTCAGGREN
jgi:hypothetical protein